MALLQDWRDKAYSQTADKGQLQRLWQEYFLREKEIYAQILKTPNEPAEGTVKELSEKFEVSVETIVAFLDGINDSLKDGIDNDIENLSEDSKVSLDYDTTKLYKNMVAAQADWLYGLEEWEAIFDEDTRKALYKEQKKSTTFVREGKKVGRNDPCPCGSGKKYKKCCGANA